MAKRSHSKPQKEPKAVPSQKREPAQTDPANNLGPLVAAFLLTFLITRIPREVVNAGLDAAWGYVLNFAHQKNLQFGTDIVYTYGPLGFLEQEWFAGPGEGLRIFFAFLRGFGIAYGVCLVAWRMRLAWRCIFLGVFILLPATVHANRIEPLLEVGLFCWAMLNLVEPDQNKGVFAIGLIAIATIGSLGKFTFFLLATMTVAVVAWHLALRGRRKWGIGIVVGYVLSSFLGWILLRQSPLILGAYFKNSLALSFGYEETMGWKTPSEIWTPGIIMMTLALATALIYSIAAYDKTVRRPGLRPTLLFGWVACFTFLFWKHGFIRHKMDLFATSVPVTVLALDILPSPFKAARLWARGCALVCCLAAGILMTTLTPGYFGDFVSTDFHLLSDNIKTLLNPSAYLARMNQSLDAERNGAQLPRIRQIVGQATVDVFGEYQSYALFNGLNYRPRPDFQSYSTYNSSLMKVNENLYNSPAAPEFVLFNLEAIDARFPPLEDAYVLRDLLINYAPIECEGRFLLLKRSQSNTPEMSLLKEGTGHIGEAISLSEYSNTDLWMEISMQPTLRGRLRKLFFKPSEIYLSVWGSQPASQPATFRAPAPMLAAGFLASPFLLRDSDVVDLYTGENIHRPGAFAIEVERRAENFWREDFDYKIYQIKSKLGRSVPAEMARLKLPGFQMMPQIVSPAGPPGIAAVGGSPALLLRPGGYMVFKVPQDARTITGNFGFAEPAYVQGSTEGAEFRVEEVTRDGASHLLYSQFLSPRIRAEDRGLKHFSVPLPAQNDETIVFRSISATNSNPQWDLTCWSEIRFETNQPPTGTQP
ncbi:MAG TPA: hypothetical protein VH413_01070 [Verrucomicrobiae bacterium]|jgi:hypothetical protein|nr:hypothetical protein [Verrucomicrobiae bacterium]